MAHIPMLMIGRGMFQRVLDKVYEENENSTEQMMSSLKMR